jgi:hypothetical protein
VSGAVGSVSYDLDVPEFGKLPLSMSGLLVTSVTRPGARTARGDEQLQKMMPAAPMSRRTFTHDDELVVFAEVYDQQASTPHSVDVRTSIGSLEGGSPVFQNSAERTSQELSSTNGTYPYAVRIPMSNIAAGRYVLTVEATSRLGPTVRRQLPIELIPDP